MYTVIDLYDVMRTDICAGSAADSSRKFSTFPWDYISRDGFYL